MTVAVLFARGDSIYRAIPGCDVWDIERDARRWPGGAPVIAHPPCRAWGCLRAFAKPRPDERALAPWAVEQVRRWGGVLEHPRGSTLWAHCGLPRPGQPRDVYGGWTLQIDQHRFGHLAEKMTWLYVVADTVPLLPPPRPHSPTHVVAPSHGIRAGHPGYRKHLPKPDRERTPPLFALWLVDLARS